MIKSEITKIFGVWANKNSELVITSKLILLYQRKGLDYLSKIQTYKITDNQFELFTKAVSLFSKSNEKAICKYFNKTRRKWIESGDKLDLQIPTQNKIFSIINSNNSLFILNGNETFLEFDKINNILIYKSDFSKETAFEQIEKIQVCKFQIGEKATQNTIGKCLTEWKLGASYFENNKNNDFTAQVITNKHSYIFTSTKWKDNKILYCRSARIKSNNEGSVFAQNIRLMKNNKDFTARMVEDNLKVSRKNIIINNRLFDAKKCVFIDGGEEIYWSLKEFSEDEIILNGCGEEYKFTRPTIESCGYEYFRLDNY